MAEQRIPNEFLDLVNQKPAICNLATLMPDGTPQVTPVWVDYDGQYILINTEQGRRKALNMHERPRVGLDIVDPSNPFRFISVRGHVAEVTEEGAWEHINKLAKRYTGADKYTPQSPNEVRQIYKILPERVIAQ